MSFTRSSSMLLALLVITVLVTGACTMIVEQPAMDHDGMDHSAVPAATAAPEEEMDSMDHGTMDHDAGDVPFDAQFIDGMIVHHQGALDMAALVLAESERPEMLAFAEAIIAAQDAEITQMQTWRDDWYPELPVSAGMDMDMGAMEISPDDSIPFDQRFLTAMISHHKGAVDMARAALEMAEHAELRTLSEEIIEVQEAEIAQMEAWLMEWFGVEAEHDEGHGSH